ncbi:MAG TPA: pyridoxal-phosphate dependent enzyme [Myxococcota bacterium]|nr:pyridoxal-phosphate dependent enzyme [Myxococcota bacterium]HRY93160.1 pyridoxal-phosphate dependent enzyme [Myxococcota bacterium]HSA22688.1 pyridoxal-phosphate dependent enzyme [Myxococcota bacterium]
MELTIREDVVRRTAKRCKDQGIIVPTFAQQKDPRKIPAAILAELKGIGLWDIHPRNLFRVTWKNDPATGGFHGVNFLEIPRELSGVKARIFGLVGKYFPTGAHKVGASFGCLVPRLVTGAFDPTRQKAVWPSTGNYCRGGAYVGKLLGCDSVAILPAEMSRERFEWLHKIGAEVIATPGCESNVKEIYDKCWELKATRKDQIVVFNQFEEFGNPTWHYEVTAAAIEEVLRDQLGSGDRLFGYVSSTGSAGTIGAGERLKELYPAVKVAAAEALQCPTLLRNGFGGHRIEGIGDKHVPWIHNVRNTDFVVAVDDADPMALIRLFNEPAGRAYLAKQGVPAATVDRLDLLGISGVANMLAAIKLAKWNELDEHDAVFTIFTDSMELYQSRLEEARTKDGPYSEARAELDLRLHLQGVKPDSMTELDHWGRAAVHNLKYYTWIEQQQRELAELNAQWYQHKTYWPEHWKMAAKYDELIEKFNQLVARS